MSEHKHKSSERRSRTSESGGRRDTFKPSPKPSPKQQMIQRATYGLNRMKSKVTDEEGYISSSAAQAATALLAMLGLAAAGYHYSDNIQNTWNSIMSSDASSSGSTTSAASDTGSDDSPSLITDEMIQKLLKKGEHTTKSAYDRTGQKMIQSFGNSTNNHKRIADVRNAYKDLPNVAQELVDDMRLQQYKDLVKNLPALQKFNTRAGKAWTTKNVEDITTIDAFDKLMKQIAREGSDATDPDHKSKSKAAEEVKTAFESRYSVEDKVKEKIDELQNELIDWSKLPLNLEELNAKLGEEVHGQLNTYIQTLQDHPSKFQDFINMQEDSIQKSWKSLLDQLKKTQYNKEVSSWKTQGWFGNAKTADVAEAKRILSDEPLNTSTYREAVDDFIKNELKKNLFAVKLGKEAGVSRMQIALDDIGDHVAMKASVKKALHDVWEHKDKTSQDTLKVLYKQYSIKPKLKKELTDEQIQLIREDVLANAYTVDFTMLKNRLKNDKTWGAKKMHKDDKTWLIDYLNGRADDWYKNIKPSTYDTGGIAKVAFFK